MVALGGFYLLYFGAIGILLPFLPAYLSSLGLPASQVGVLLAIGPALALVSPHLFGHLADRSGRPDRLLTLIGLGTCLGFAPLLWAERFWSLLLALTAYAFFGAAVTTVLDSLALLRLAETGGSYARLRALGSLGFVISSTAFGLSVPAVNRATVAVPAALIALYSLWSLSLPRPPGLRERRHSPSLFGGSFLIGQRDLRPFLFATCLHWIACAPFHGTFSIHVQALSLRPWVVGLSAGLGVLAEIAVMLLHPRFAARIAPRHLLAVSFGASALRWLGMSVVTDRFGLIALQLLHGLTFGAFYVSAVAYLTRRVPAEMRATGQALFVSVTFGLGGLLGYLLSGVGYDALGGQALFAVAAGVELVALAIVWGTLKPEPTPAW